MTIQRREWLFGAGAVGVGTMGLTALGGCATPASRSAKVVVVGGGYGGATAAKYLRLFSGGRLDVTLVEPGDAFVSCPISNLVVGGFTTMSAITTPYAALGAKHGV